MKKAIYLSTFLLSLAAWGQLPWDKDTLSLVFIGDVMGHEPQIASAYKPERGTYDYDDVFAKVAPLLDNADFTIANLEVTLAGKPYTGYPQFSSPDELAVACKKSGIDVFVTANNHSCDKGKAGILRTLRVLDSLGLKHTGTFRDPAEREANNLLVIGNHTIRVGLLNYTYGTNGLPAPPPTIVNLIDTLTMAADIEKSKAQRLDKLIVMLHWGDEYQSHPSEGQLKIADFLFRKGADIIIGAHPHVLQRMEYFPGNDLQKERFIAYSLGNFVSNQRVRKRDGGAIIALTLTKTGTETVISDRGYQLVWVNKPKTAHGETFEVIPCATYERDGFKNLDAESIEKMKVFIEDSRKLLREENKQVNEF